MTYISSEETFLQDFSGNSETNASELLENLEEMFPLILSIGSHLQSHTGL